MNNADQDDGTTRRNRAPERAGNRHGRGSPDRTRDAPPRRCPSCGQPIVATPESVQGYERFLKRLFDRQDQFENSLAFAIHDGLAQQLTGALFCLDAPAGQDVPPNDAQEKFRVGLKLVRDSIDDARRIAGQLRPLMCDDHGITVEIEYLVHQLKRQYEPEIVFLVKGKMGRLASELESGIFRIVRELLRNACCHSGSKQVRLELARTKGRLRIAIKDWGTGFDPSKVNGESLGLREVRQRATLLGGQVTIDSAPGKGTRAIVTFPVDEMSGSRDRG
jgi:signal transduction histidine kinase